MDQGIQGNGFSKWQGLHASASQLPRRMRRCKVAQVEFAKNKVYKISMALERKTRSQSRFGSIIHQREMPIDPSTINVL